MCAIQDQHFLVSGHKPIFEIFILNTIHYVIEIEKRSSEEAERGFVGVTQVDL